MAIPLGRPLPSASCDRPERRREGSPGISGMPRDACRSYLVLLPVGFSLPPPLPAARCALAAPFHPCRPPGVPRRTGGVLSVALSLGSPPPGVTRHRTSVEPGLSSLRTRRRAAIRPSGNRRFRYGRGSCRGPCAWVPGSQLRRAPERQLRQSLDDHFVEVRHSGFCSSIRRIFQSRRHFLSSFSRLIAVAGSS